ncbi:uncharacterized protein LOC126795593 [Argentina anserina]|uniref:uncharacterized protein LOC126795593 n=1 Tax=Argentina anserina TaxID=57926 RepID=UPI0021766E0D|nr:uncharacterized protein LOC126795593 [Potentilla anserina]
MNSFSSELGLQFGSTLEAPHVIDVWPTIISTGPGNVPLNASYKTAGEYASQKKFSEVCQVGALCFSQVTSKWGSYASVGVKQDNEPGGGEQEEFEFVLKSYYDSISWGKKPVFGRIKGANKKLTQSSFTAVKCAQKNNIDGAALLAVCRGKVSEGIDFTDDNARAVIIVGIPFPNMNDIKVSLKKKYNDAYKSSKGFLSGNEWYCHQAFRALNQAAGRCIRHRFDYGAVIILDERYQVGRNTAYVSKWLKKSMRQYESFNTSMEELKSFFSSVKSSDTRESHSFFEKSEFE